MKTDWPEVIATLERDWEAPDGFLFRCRAGDFDRAGADRLLSALRDLRFDADEPIPSRVVTLLWVLPVFLEWQRDRVRRKADDVAAYDKFREDVVQTLVGLLGAP